MNKSKIVKLIREDMMLLIRPFVKVDDNMIIYKSFSGSYSDSPKYIARKMHKIHPEVKQYWDLGNSNSSKGNRELDDFIIPIYSNKLNYCYYINKAKVLVDNYQGYFISKNPTKHDFKLKNKKQFNLSTSHGKPFKSSNNNIEKNANVFFTSTDMLTSGSKHLSEKLNEIYVSRFDHEVPIVLTGTPRSDVSFNITKDSKKKMKQKLGLPIDKKIILFAPTFRKDKNQSGPAQLKDLDIDVLLKTLGQKFGGDWAFVYRVHHVVEGLIDNNSLSNKNMYNGNTHDDMADYIVASDCLLTDYSSCIHDFALTKNPIFLYALDFDKYANKEREICFDFKDTPFSFADSSKKLIKNIKNFDDKKYKTELKKFFKSTGDFEDGKASERIVDIIYEKMKEK